MASLDLAAGGGGSLLLLSPTSSWGGCVSKHLEGLQLSTARDAHEYRRDSGDWVKKNKLSPDGAKRGTQIRSMPAGEFEPT